MRDLNGAWCVMTQRVLGTDVLDRLSLVEAGIVVNQQVDVPTNHVSEVIMSFMFYTIGNLGKMLSERNTCARSIERRQALLRVSLTLLAS